MDRISLLTTFVAIADAGSISSAARTLRLSVPMTSRHLRALEKEYGVSLVRRTTRQLDLTHAGRELLPRARRLLRDLDEAREAVQPHAGAVGRIVISMPVAFGMRQIAPLVPELLAAHPRLSLSLRFEDRTVDLLSEGVDLALRVGMDPPDSTYLIARKLGEYERVLCATPDVLRTHPIKSAETLAHVPCVLLGASPTTWHFAGAPSVVVEGRVNSNNMLAVHEATLAGLGFAQLPRWLVEDDLRANRLRTVLDDLALPPVTVMGLISTEVRQVESLRVIQDFIATKLGALKTPARAARRSRAVQRASSKLIDA